MECARGREIEEEDEIEAGPLRYSDTLWFWVSQRCFYFLCLFFTFRDTSSSSYVSWTFCLFAFRLSFVSSVEIVYPSKRKTIIEIYTIRNIFEIEFRDLEYKRRRRKVLNARTPHKTTYKHTNDMHTFTLKNRLENRYIWIGQMIPCHSI